MLLYINTTTHCYLTLHCCNIYLIAVPKLHVCFVSQIVLIGMLKVF